VGTLDLEKITALWERQNCSVDANDSAHCTLLYQLQDADLLEQLMEAIQEQGGQPITYDEAVQLMQENGMTPDAFSKVYTEDADRFDGKEVQVPYTNAVVCDYRELSCRDGRACYPKGRRCDFKVCILIN
jgi:hypothetical protein